MRLLWRDREDTLSQLRARDRPAAFSWRKDAHLLSPLILSGWRPQKSNVSESSLSVSDPQVERTDILLQLISCQICLHPAGTQTTPILNEINSRWEFSCSPVFPNFLRTVPHLHSDWASLDFQTLSPWIDICASSQSAGSKLFFFLSFLVFWALFPKPKGTIRQCSNLENHHPSATRFLASTLCALNINGENPFGCVRGWREGSQRHRGTFQTRLLPSTTQWALELAGAPADTQPFCRRDDQGGQEVPTSQGLFPAWWSDRQPHTPQTPSHHNDQIEIFVCADAWPPRQQPKSSLNYSPTFILHFIPGTGRRGKGLQVVVRLRKCPSAIFSWEKKKRKKRESKSTPELWHACWLMMGGVLPRTPGNLAVLVHYVRETEAWLQSERMVRIPRNPVATALKYESVSPSLLLSLPLSSVFYKLWSLPLPLIHALKQSNRSLDPSTVSSCFLLKCGNTLTFSTTIDVFPNKHWQHDTHIKPVGQLCCSWYSASGDEKTSSTTNLKHLWKM